MKGILESWRKRWKNWLFWLILSVRMWIYLRLYLWIGGKKGCRLFKYCRMHVKRLFSIIRDLRRKRLKRNSNCRESIGSWRERGRKKNKGFYRRFRNKKYCLKRRKRNGKILEIVKNKIWKRFNNLKSRRLFWIIRLRLCSRMLLFSSSFMRSWRSKIILCYFY